MAVAFSRQFFVTLLLVVDGAAWAKGPAPGENYLEQRHAFRTAIHDSPKGAGAAPRPPSGVYELVRYRAPLGLNVAYVTPVHKDGRKRPGIVWLQGGFDWSIDDSAWKPAARENDQSARAFREAGLVEMIPALRGGNDNPGDREYFLGEVDDLLAAVEFLRKRPDVDPARVYLAGHSTGATTVLLAAASRPRVTAVFAFGPLDSIVKYGPTGTALDRANKTESAMRSPAAWIGEATVPVYVIEGDRSKNAEAFEPLRTAAGNAPVRLLLAHGATHFSTLAPITELIAARLMSESRGGPPFALSEADLAAAVAGRGSNPRK